ncbi:Structure-specific endonuclease subunit SLX1 [Mycena indigotica]|uniref:Structure-specific endonuclease subunit SLX1 n=1 Tax=Mycena indigotica TaxID=2126181 RepID=A0A8H6TAN4_9AGAR|nr:Structure-specific endonuclease subunit SLX1 [Mycena indigotica]KAF7315275.1 Structure-specific endonuclease subunit SLX1 [Mycena indigotica]
MPVIFSNRFILQQPPRTSSSSPSTRLILTSTYIGSTPNPPKRIRQHNGELTQGAFKTKSKRPWIMQMIVYGFPSKLTALQFEWAWQHSHKSRHLRDAEGKPLLSPARVMRAHIRAVRLMIATYWASYSLHVKLFTEAAVRDWKAAEQVTPVLPVGFTCQVELEGVNGRSGKAGSGRDGPILVDDGLFTSALLAKNNALAASGKQLTCSICGENLSSHNTEALRTALCPVSGCSSIAHLTCLSQKFLTKASTSSGILPRGGNCVGCGTYVLWGNIVHGSFRRAGMVADPEGDEDALFLSDSDEDQEPTKSRSKRRVKPANVSSEGEEFDFGAVDRGSDRAQVKSQKRIPQPTGASRNPRAASLALFESDSCSD